jgi:hypothetical protein
MFVPYSAASDGFGGGGAVSCAFARSAIAAFVRCCAIIDPSGS